MIQPGETNEPKTGRFGSKDVDSTSDINQVLSPEDDAEKSANVRSRSYRIVRLDPYLRCAGEYIPNF